MGCLFWPYMTSKREHSWEISICMRDKVGRGVFRILFFKGRNLSKILITRLRLSGSDGKGSACSTGDLGLIPVYWEISRRSLLEKEIATTPVFLPGEFHRQRGLMGYSSWGHKELAATYTFPFTWEAQILPELDFLYILLMPSFLILAFTPSS